jgi:hypothetical protein
MNTASWLVESGCQFPISVSALVINTGGVGLGGTSVEGIGVEVGGISVGGTGVGLAGTSVEGTGVAEGALHPTRNKRTTAIFANGCDNFWVHILHLRFYFMLLSANHQLILL